MTISNNSGTPGNAKIVHSDNIKKQLIEHYIRKTKTSGAGNINISKIYDIFCPSSAAATLTEEELKECEDSYQITILGAGSTIKSDGDLPEGVTHVIYSGGDLTINSDLKYTNGIYYSAFNVPQYIIYAKGNIYIDADVSEIDAILISDGTINTCAQSTSPDREKCQQKQLVIKGPVFANRLNLTRAYSDANKEPAERIIFPASTNFWANTQSEKYSRATTTYIRELAPRF